MVEHHDTLEFIQAQELIRLKQVPLRIATSLRVGPGRAIHRRKQWSQGKLIVSDGDRDLAAFLCKILRARHIVAAHIERHIKGTELIFPFLTRILFLPLGERLHRHLHGHIKAADGVEYIRDAFHIADVEVFLQAEVRQHGKPPAVEPGVVRELRERQREKEGA